MDLSVTGSGPALGPVLGVKRSTGSTGLKGMAVGKGRNRSLPRVELGN